MGWGFLVKAALLASLLGMAGAAHAAEFMRSPDPDRRPGMPLGAFRLSPAIEAGIAHDDNIFRESSGGTSSLIVRVAPSLTLQSGWRRHSLSLTAGAVAGRFLSSQDDDFLDASLSAEAIADITRATRARLVLDLDRGHEARGTDDAPVALSRPVRFLTFGAELTGQYDPGRLRIQPFVGFERVNFQDAPLQSGLTADQDDRDRDLMRLGLLVGWRLVGRSELFAEGVITSTNFQDALDRNGLDRDNRSYRVLAGARLNLTRLIGGRMAAGYERRVFDGPALPAFSGPVIEAALRWEPTRLLSFDLNAVRRVEETTVAAASAADVTSVEVRAQWEVKRFIDLTVLAAFEHRDFRGLPRTDRTLTLGLGAEWSATRRTTIEARLRHVRERSDAPGEGHISNQIWLGARYAF